MPTVALILSILLAALGTLGLVLPQRLADLARQFLTPGGLILAAAIRILFGLVLVFAAPNARTPEFVRVIGIISLVAGVMTPLLRVEQHRKILDWWVDRGSGLMRIWSAVGLVFGLVLAYAFIPREHPPLLLSALCVEGQESSCGGNSCGDVCSSGNSAGRLDSAGGPAIRSTHRRHGPHNVS